MATWPATIPDPLVEPYAPKLSLPAARQDFRTGYAAPRRLATVLPQSLVASWALSRDQARDFVLFARDHADEWFELNLRMPGEADATTPALARFTSSVSMTAVPDGWRCRAELEVAA